MVQRAPIWHFTTGPQAAPDRRRAVPALPDQPHDKSRHRHQVGPDLHDDPREFMTGYRVAFSGMKDKKAVARLLAYRNQAAR